MTPPAAPLPLRPATAARDLGATAVFTPFPDDEPLTCAGLLALLTAAGAPARLVILAGAPDGRPLEACLADERAALAALGLDADAVVALGLPAGALPEEGTAAFERAADALADALRGIETVIVPCRYGCDAEHAATWALARAAAARLDDPPRWIEHLDPDAPAEAAARGAAWRLDIRPVLDRKRDACAAARADAGDAPWEAFVETPRPWIHHERVF